MSTKALHPTGRLLMGPGPSSVDRRVLEALAKPIVGHLDPQFLALMNEIQDMLRSLYRTENRLTISVSGTGSAGMETTFVNLVEPGDEVLVFVNGVFVAGFFITCMAFMASFCCTSSRKTSCAI